MTTEDEARLDIKRNGVWGTRLRKTYFDVKVFYTLEKAPEKLLQLSRAVEEAGLRGLYPGSGKRHICTVGLACSGGAGPCATQLMTRTPCETKRKKR